MDRVDLYGQLTRIDRDVYFNKLSMLLFLKTVFLMKVAHVKSLFQIAQHLLVS
jgi:hypothetical protein